MRIKQNERILNNNAAQPRCSQKATFLSCILQWTSIAAFLALPIAAHGLAIVRKEGDLPRPEAHARRNEAAADVAHSHQYATGGKRLQIVVIALNRRRPQLERDRVVRQRPVERRVLIARAGVDSAGGVIARVICKSEWPDAVVGVSVSSSGSDRTSAVVVVAPSVP